MHCYLKLTPRLGLTVKWRVFAFSAQTNCVKSNCWFRIVKHVVQSNFTTTSLCEENVFLLRHAVFPVHNVLRKLIQVIVRFPYQKQDMFLQDWISLFQFVIYLCTYLRLPGTYAAKIDKIRPPPPLHVSLHNSVTRPYLKGSLAPCLVAAWSQGWVCWRPHLAGMRQYSFQQP